MVTYSINDSTNTESISYPLNEYLNDILISLQDNQDGDIDPIDIRNAVLSGYSSIPIKETISDTNKPFIGFDSGNPIDNDIKGNKILLSKREIYGVDIMDNDLLNSDSDIIFHNTKINESDSTKLSILTGINPTNKSIIESNVVYTPTPSIQLNIKNDDDINLSGSVSINGLTISGTPMNNDFVVFNNNELIFSDLAQVIGSDLGTSSNELILNGDVNVNGYSLIFNDNRYIPTTIGSVKRGTKLENKSLESVLKGIVYSYLKPSCSLKISQKYWEYGSYPNPLIEYKINKRTNPLIQTSLMNMNPSSVSAITTEGDLDITGTAIGYTIGKIESNQEYKITISEGGTYSNFSFSDFIEPVYPYYYGISNQGFVNNNLVFNMNNIIINSNDNKVELLGSGNLYYMFDSNYPVLSEIRDENNIDILSDFTSFTQSINSPNGNWSNHIYLIYTKPSFNTTEPIFYTFKH